MRAESWAWAQVYRPATVCPMHRHRCQPRAHKNWREYPLPAQPCRDYNEGCCPREWPMRVQSAVATVLAVALTAGCGQDNSPPQAGTAGAPKSPQTRALEAGAAVL